MISNRLETIYLHISYHNFYFILLQFFNPQPTAVRGQSAVPPRRAGPAPQRLPHPHTVLPPRQGAPLPLRQRRCCHQRVRRPHGQIFVTSRLNRERRLNQQGEGVTYVYPLDS